MSKQRRIKKLVEQRLNATTGTGAAAAKAFATLDDQKTEEARLKTLSDAALLAVLLDPDADNLATDVQSQKEAAKAGIASGGGAGEILQTAGKTESELGTDALDADTDNDTDEDGAEVIAGGRDPLVDDD
jgi:hypothetical protein